MCQIFVLTRQPTDLKASVPFVRHFNNKKRSCAAKEAVSLCSATLCVRHSVATSLLFGKNIFPVVAGRRQRGGWLSSGAATCLVLALIWRGGNRDLTALPQKSEPSDARKRDLLSPPTHTHTHTRAVCFLF